MSTVVKLKSEPVATDLREKLREAVRQRNEAADDRAKIDVALTAAAAQIRTAARDVASFSDIEELASSYIADFLKTNGRVPSMLPPEIEERKEKHREAEKHLSVLHAAESNLKGQQIRARAQVEEWTSKASRAARDVMSDKADELIDEYSAAKRRVWELDDLFAALCVVRVPGDPQPGCLSPKAFAAYKAVKLEAPILAGSPGVRASVTAANEVQRGLIADPDLQFDF